MKTNSLSKGSWLQGCRLLFAAALGFAAVTVNAADVTYSAKEAVADGCFNGGPSGHIIYLPMIDPANPGTTGMDDGYKFVATPLGTFTEFMNGTATLTASTHSTLVAGFGWDITVNFSGLSNTGFNVQELMPSCYVPPFGTGGPVNPASWHHYANYTGRLIGTGHFAGAIVDITESMHPLQVGVGGAGKNVNLGASGWFSWVVVHQPTDPTYHLQNSCDVNNTCNQMMGQGTWYGDLNFNLLTPGIKLVKTADKTTINPGGTVTYTYAVTNTGNVTLTNVTVVDDNGTPGNPADDFTVGTIATLAPGASQTFTHTVTLQPPATPPSPQDLCVTCNNQSIKAGTLTTTVLPSGDIQVTYVQSQAANDNRYGTGANATTGWASGHKFNDLVGSDQAEFRFTDSQGNVVLDFQLDYISAAASKTFAGCGPVTYPSGYGTLGGNGGDGKLISGNINNLLCATTSLTDNLKQSQFQSGFLVNSPPETAPNSGVSVPAGWNYDNSYTVVISKNAFGGNTFGGVSIVGVHNSPSKTACLDRPAPTPCSTPPPCVVNVATATGSANGTTLSATATATVCFGTMPCSGLVDCTPPYPFQSANPLTNIPFNESEVLRDAALSFDANCKPVALQVFYNDEHALTLGVRQVNVLTKSGKNTITTTTNYTVTPLSTNPGSAVNPSVGSTASSGDQAGTDLAGRPLYPALYITDLTLNPGNPLAGDWQNGGTAILPNAVFGTWKAAVRTVDKTKTPNVATVTPDADPAKNNYTLGAGSDPVPTGLTNQGYGAEVRWDLSTLGLISGHQYRLYFMVHDGDQNKSGGDVGQECATFTMP